MLSDFVGGTIFAFCFAEILRMIVGEYEQIAVCKGYNVVDMRIPGAAYRRISITKSFLVLFPYSANIKQGLHPFLVDICCFLIAVCWDRGFEPHSGPLFQRNKMFLSRSPVKIQYIQYCGELPWQR